jgi:hypothetical protein
MYDSGGKVIFFQSFVFFLNWGFLRLFVLKLNSLFVYAEGLLFCPRALFYKGYLSFIFLWCKLSRFEQAEFSAGDVSKYIFSPMVFFLVLVTTN